MAVISFEGPGGATVFVEASDPKLAESANADTEHVTRGLGRQRAEVLRADRTLEVALEGVRPTISAVADLMRAVSPDEWEVTFGISLSAQAGALIARASVAGNFQIRMSWNSTTAAGPKSG